MTILVSVVIILGFFTLSKLPLALYPDMKLPYAAVMTTYSGAGPEEVEQVTKSLEGQINSLSNVKKIESYSMSGSSIMLVSFNWGTDMSSAINDIREKTSLIEKYLPDGVDKPMVVKMDVNMMPIIQTGVEAKGNVSLAELQSIAEDEIKPRLERIPEVASVIITGGQEREVKVEVDPAKLESYGLTLAQISQYLQAENFNMSSGQVKTGQRKYYVRNLQEFESIDDIKDVNIVTTSGNSIRLADIATVTDGFKDDNQITRLNGGAAVGIHCQKQSDANTVTACEHIKAELDQVQKEMGQKLDIKVVMDQSHYINQSINTVTRMILEGALLAVLILFLFLRNTRSTLIIFTAIPLSIIATFVLMYFNNDTLNIITLGGLALGLGRMVDDSIVVFENVYRHRSLGLSPVDAAVTGASQVSNAVIASTLTILAVFLPVMFVTEGIASVIFKPLAVTVSFAILCSLMVALTVVPLMSSRMLTDAAMQKRETGTGWLATKISRLGNWIDNLGEQYQEIVKWSLSHRRTVVIAVTVLMIGSCALIPFIGAEFMPKMDSGEISISLEADKGNVMADTDRMIKTIEKNCMI
jgi:HAE1 family hydrophobic/amphiphilic exporter-1